MRGLVLRTPPACLSLCRRLKEASVFWMEQAQAPAAAFAALPDTVVSLSVTTAGTDFQARVCRMHAQHCTWAGRYLGRHVILDKS